MELREIPGYPGYLACDDGSIWSLPKNTRKNAGLKKLKGRINRYGYMDYSIRDTQGVRHYPTGHRLVALAFLGESELQVDHINCDKLDNRPCNLRYVTSKENIAHAIESGVKYLCGEESHKNSARPVNQYTITGEYVATYKSCTVAARIVGCNVSHIAACVRGEHNTAGGYIWRAADKEMNPSPYVEH